MSHSQDLPALLFVTAAIKAQSFSFGKPKLNLVPAYPTRELVS